MPGERQHLSKLLSLCPLQRCCAAPCLSLAAGMGFHQPQQVQRLWEALPSELPPGWRLLQGGSHAGEGVPQELPQELNQAAVSHCLALLL